MTKQWMALYERWKAKAVVDAQNDRVGSARVEPGALTYTLTGTLAKVTADSIGEKNFGM